MNNTFSKAIFFMFFFLFMFFLVPQVFEKHRDAKNWDIIYNKDNEIDMLYMGSSLTFTSLDPNIIDPLINYNSFNLGSSAQNIIQTYYNLVEVLKYRKIELIILDVNTIISENNKIGFIYNNLSGMNFSENKINSYLNTINKNSITDVVDISKTSSYVDWGKIVSLIIKEKFNWKNDIKNFDEILYGNKELRNLKGFYAREKHISLEDYNLVRSQELEIKTIGSKNQKYFDNFINLCINNEIDLILIQTPTLEKRSIDNLNYFINKYKIPYYDFSFKNDNEYNLYDYKDFSDKLHFSSMGAQKFSLVFANAFNSYLNYGRK